MPNWGRMIEQLIRKAEAEGQLKGLSGEGRPLPDRPGDALIDPGAAVGFRIMAEAGAVPEEIALKAARDSARLAWQRETDPARKKKLMGNLADLQLRYDIAREARQKFLR